MTWMIFFLLLSLTINSVLIWYIMRLVRSCYVSSNAFSEVLLKLDTYREHLKSIYELQTFYGDKELQGVLNHTRELVLFLNDFNGVSVLGGEEMEEFVQKLREEDDDDDGKRTTN